MCTAPITKARTKHSRNSIGHLRCDDVLIYHQPAPRTFRVSRQPRTSTQIHPVRRPGTPTKRRKSAQKRSFAAVPFPADKIGTEESMRSPLEADFCERSL